jgi:hypothetical protein
MTHLHTSNTSYGQKKVRELNWQFDSEPPKVANRPYFFVFGWRETYCWKALNKGYNFTLDFISIEDPHAKLWAPQSCESPNFGNFGTPKTKWHLGDDPVAKHIVLL